MAQAAPKTAPDFMHSTVPEPMARFGASSEIRGSSEAAPESASSETAAPGRMAPPSRREFGPMTVMVVAVPMSMMMTGGSCASRAATAPATRSAPICEGSSMPMLRPVFTPAPTTRAS